MNPILTILLLALAAMVLILLAAAVISLLVVSAGEKYAARQRAALEQQLTALLGGESNAQLAQKLLDGELTPEECTEIPEENALQVRQLLRSWQEEKQRVRMAAEESRKKRRQRKGWLRSEADKG